MITIVEREGTYYLQHNATGKWYYQHFNNLKMAQMVKEIICDHWIRKLVGEERQVGQQFVANKEDAKPYSSKS